MPRKKTSPEAAPRTLEEYLALNYRYELVRDEDAFVALHPDLLGCIAQGETADEAVQSLDLARRLWIEARYEERLPIPEPVSFDELSGKILLRIPPTLHAQLARNAEQQGVSLNQLINNALSEFVGISRGESALAETLLTAIAQLVAAKSPAPAAAVRPRGLLLRAEKPPS